MSSMPAMQREHDGETVDLSLRLRYAHGLGSRRPFFSALTRGQLIASSCLDCGNAFVPPRFVCTCGHSEHRWVDLSGIGTVDACTATSVILPAHAGPPLRQAFVLVRFDGSANAALARSTTECAVVGMRVRLQAPTERAAAVRHPVESMFVVAA